MDLGRGEGLGTLLQSTTVVTMSAVVDTQSRCANIEGISETFLSKCSCSKSGFTRQSMICVECKKSLGCAKLCWEQSQAVGFYAVLKNL